jgi:hypothetical protein
MSNEKKPFNLPIYYLPNKHKLDKNILEDLELINTTDPSNTPLYHYVFNPNNYLGERTVTLWGEYYTNDVAYLKDTQTLIKDYQGISDKDSTAINFDEIKDIWQEIKNETGFEEKYQYLDMKWVQYLNHNAAFLQILSIYNMSAPLVSLALPFLFLLLPFVILRAQGHAITMPLYYKSLREVFERHAIGQFLFKFNVVSFKEKIYLLVSVLFYLFQVYQNCVACYRFYKNMYKINDYLFKMREYIGYSLKTMDNYSKYSSTLPQYQLFNEETQKHYQTLLDFKSELDRISKCSFNLTTIKQIGHTMKCFYDLYSVEKYNDALEYSYGFNGYIDNICEIQNHIGNTNMNFCTYTKNKSDFKGAYYPALIREKPVKNSYNLKKHILITGPNAAGKTTLLKSTLFNIILSQQLGCGFYKNASVLPYRYIHCYLNIPDTSGRDSLFQAEARRCKEILTCIQESESNDRHFCIFDELYSGTNPYEAVGSAFSFLTFLTKYKNVDFILTTHYLDLCKRLNKNKNIVNCKMQIKEKSDNHFNYTYKLKKGISTIKGGTKVLNDLQYPKEIVNATMKTLTE